MLAPQVIAVLFLVSSTLAVPGEGYWSWATKGLTDTLVNTASYATNLAASNVLSTAAFGANLLNGDYKKPVSLDAATIAQIPKASGPEIATIKEFSMLAKAAYDVDDEAHEKGHVEMMENWECELCKKTGLVPDTKPVAVLAKHDTSMHVYVTSFASKNAIIVAFKGTDGKIDMLSDLYAVPVPNTEIGGTVHKGFQSSFESGKAFVDAEVAKLLGLHPKFGIVVIGHSLGGAIATLAAGHLSKTHPNVNVRLITYCQPRVGDIVFTTAMNKIPNLTGMRYVHYNDPVPHAPFQMGFKFVHYGTEFWSPAPKSLDILKCSPENDAESEKCSNAIYMSLSLETIGYHSLLPGVQF